MFWWIPFCGLSGIILSMGLANEQRRHSMPPLIGWVHTLNDPWGFLGANSALVWMMAWHWIDDKPLSKPMMAFFLCIFASKGKEEWTSMITLSSWCHDTETTCTLQALCEENQPASNWGGGVLLTKGQWCNITLSAWCHDTENTSHY